MAITSEPFEPSVDYGHGYRSGCVSGLGYALERAKRNDDDKTFKDIMTEGLRRYGDNFRAEAERRGIEL